MFVEVDENSAVPPGNLFVKAENKVLGARNPLAPHQVQGARWDANRSFSNRRLAVLEQALPGRSIVKDEKKSQVMVSASMDSLGGSAGGSVKVEPVCSVRSDGVSQKRVHSTNQFTKPLLASSGRNNGSAVKQDHSFRQLPVGVQDIDEPSRDPVSLIPAYAQANTELMRVQEMTSGSSADYMDTVQKNIKPRMRTLVIDWLIDVADDFRMVTESLYLTVAHFDRFLSLVPVHQNDLQLIATACMLIATKFEEIHPPPLDKLSEITLNHYSPEAIVNAESYILSVLDFRIAVPTAKVFVQRFLRAVSEATEMEYKYLEQYVRYVLELALRDYGCLQFRPSTLAAGTLLLSRFILAGPAAGTAARAQVVSSWCGQWVTHRLWSKTTEYYTFHSAADLKPCVRHLHQLLMRDHQLKNSAPFRKYGDRRRKNVSKFQVPVLDDSIFSNDFSCPVPSHWLPGGCSG